MKRYPRRHDLHQGQLKRALVSAAEDALKANGWIVSREKHVRGTSVRRIVKATRVMVTTRLVDHDGKRLIQRGPETEVLSHLIAIRTSQNGVLALSRDRSDTLWVGLSDVNFILVSCVDDLIDPTNAVMHLFEAKAIYSRFSSEYAGHKKKGIKIRPGPPVSLPLHQIKSLRSEKYIGGETGVLKSAEQSVPLENYLKLPDPNSRDATRTETLTLKEAKRRLAPTYGVEIDDIEIKVKTGNSGKARRRRGSLSRVQLKNALFNSVENYLYRNVFKVEKDPTQRGYNTRRVTFVSEIDGKKSTSYVSIHTSATGKIGFKRDEANTYWIGLEKERELLIACAYVTDLSNPPSARIIIIEDYHLRSSLDRALSERKAAGRPLKAGTALWLPLDPLSDLSITPSKVVVDVNSHAFLPPGYILPVSGQPTDILTIAEAQRLLALSFDVDIDGIEITIVSRKRRKPEIRKRGLKKSKRRKKATRKS